MNTRKFKAPFDIPEWDIKKGNIFEQGKDPEEYWSNNQFYLPASIVEQWEEVFDEQPKSNFYEDLKSEIDNNIESLNKLKKALETGYIKYETNRT